MLCRRACVGTGWLLFKGRCQQKVTCRGSTVQYGKLKGNKCKCLDGNCFFCDRSSSGDVCKGCRNGYYLHKGTCLKSCPAAQTSFGSGTFKRKCMQPFTCKSGALMDGPVRRAGVNYGCRCPLGDNSGSDKHCFSCDFDAGAYGQKCTRCRNKQFLHQNRCVSGCQGTGLIEYSPGAYGRECRKPFTCSLQAATSLFEDAQGAGCKCPASLGPSSGTKCAKCHWSERGPRCLWCAQGILDPRTGTCVEKCRKPLVATQTHLDGTMCLPQDLAAAAGGLD